MIARHRRAAARVASVLISLGLGLGLDFGVSVPAWAGMAIEGGPDALRLEANGASLEDVLAALRAKFNLRYQASPALDSSITGTYQGPLARVASRLLGDYDFVIKRSAENVEVFIFRRRGQADKPIVANSSAEDAGGVRSPRPGIQQTATTGAQQTASSGAVRRVAECDSSVR